MCQARSSPGLRSQEPERANPTGKLTESHTKLTRERHTTGMPDLTLGQMAALEQPAFGKRLRQLRRARSLTQGDLAGDDVTIGYVSRIESGQRRPDARLVRLFAERLDVSVDALVIGVDDAASATRLAEAEVRWALQTGDAAGGLDLANGLLNGATDGDEAVRARLLYAEALEASGHLQDAIVELAAVVSATDGVIQAEAATSLCRCYREAGELQRAITVGQTELARLVELGLGESDWSVRLTVTVAAAYFEQGDTNHAVRLCREACDRADSTGSVRARASAYWNASIMESRRGATESAVSLAELALDMLRLDESARDYARLQIQLGIMLIRLDPPRLEEASEALHAARAQLIKDNGAAADLANCDVALARVSMMAGDTAAATTAAHRAIDSLHGEAPIALTEALVVLGELAAGAGDLAQARGYIEQAVAALTAAGSDRAAAQLWFDLAARLQALGQTEAALEAYRSASVAAGLLPTVMSPRILPDGLLPG